MRREWRLLVGLAVSALCLFLAVRNISLPALKDAISVARWEWAILAMAVIVATTFFKAVRWRVLFHPQRIRLGRAWSVLMIGQMLNAVLPARAGEIGRIYFIGEEGEVSRAAALSTVVVEKVVDLLMLAMAFLIVALWLASRPAGLPDWLQDAGTGLIPLAVLALAGLLALARFGHPLWGVLRKGLSPFSPRWRTAADGAATQAIDALGTFQHSRASWQIWAWSLVIWVLMALTNALLFYAFDLSLPLFVAILLLVVLMSGVAVPPLPGNVGVLVYLCVLVLALFGVSRETALLYGVTLQIVAYLPPIVLGSACLLRQNRSLRRAPREDRAEIHEAYLEQQREESGTIRG